MERKGIGCKNVVQYPAINSKRSDACKVKLTGLCNMPVCAMCLLEWKNGGCGSWVLQESVS